MSSNCVVGCVVLVLATSTAFAAEPTSLEQVKAVVIRDFDPTAETTICISFLEDSLAGAGFTLVTADGAADAEVFVAISIRGNDYSYLVKILSLPSHRELFKFRGKQENSLLSACEWMGKRVASAIEEAEGQTTKPKPKESKESN